MKKVIEGLEGGKAIINLQEPQLIQLNQWWQRQK